MKPSVSTPTRQKLGVCQWFHYEDDEALQRAAALMRRLGVRKLRTGVSWADYHRPGGKAWYDHQMRTLAAFDVLLSVWHTPPSIAEGAVCAGPPRDLESYAGFIHELITRYGDQFAEVELWNEPNNKLKWDFERFDPRWAKFGAMVKRAGHVAHRMGKRTVLGGMIPVDVAWLELMKSYGVLDAVDVVAIHGFPGMWWPNFPNWEWHRDWHGWAEKIAKVRQRVDGREVWVTETGRATWDLPAGEHGLYREQVRCLEQAAAAPAERVYWYSLIDLDPRRDAIEGFHVDENEYHLGLETFAGRSKPALRRFAELMGVRRPAKGRKRRRTAVV